MAPRRACSRAAQGEIPQLPAMLVVIPCRRFGAEQHMASGSGANQSTCEWMSTNPGATTRPVTSITVPLDADGPTDAIRSSSIATSPHVARASASVDDHPTLQCPRASCHRLPPEVVAPCAKRPPGGSRRVIRPFSHDRLAVDEDPLHAAGLLGIEEGAPVPQLLQVE